jgi:hypothetical protein
MVEISVQEELFLVALSSGKLSTSPSLKFLAWLKGTFYENAHMDFTARERKYLQW